MSLILRPRQAAQNPVGPEPVAIPMPGATNWRKFVESLASDVRELPPGQRPKDWDDGASVAGATAVASAAEREGSRAAVVDTAAIVDTAAMPEGRGEATVARERYKVQFTASQEYADLLERAQDLLSHAIPNRSLEEVHLRALRLLVQQLEKRKYGAPRPKPSAGSKPSVDPARPAGPKPSASSKTAVDSARAAGSATAGSARAAGSATAVAHDLAVVPSSETQRRAPRSKKHTHVTRQRGSAAVQREVRDRDGLQCAFVDEEGRRCTESRFLEPHHVLAHARGGRDTAPRSNAIVFWNPSSFAMPIDSLLVGAQSGHWG